MKLAAAVLGLALLAPLGGCAASAAPPAFAATEGTGFFDPRADARTALDAAIARAAVSNRRVLVVFGANWCHDSRALARWLDGKVLQPVVAKSFELVFVDAGTPQTGRGRNLDLAERHGVTGITGTPTLLVLDGQGKLLNTPEDARSWRNAESRGEDAVAKAIAGYAGA